HAHREVRRARATAFPFTQEAVDDPVLERVERDHGEATAWPQHLERGGERSLERAQLVVDRDPERLEDPLCRVTFTEPHGRGYRTLDRVHELAGPFERLLFPPPHDCAGDLLREALLAVAAEDRHALPLPPPA